MAVKVQPITGRQERPRQFLSCLVQAIEMIEWLIAPEQTPSVNDVAACEDVARLPRLLAAPYCLSTERHEDVRTNVKGHDAKRALHHLTRWQHCCVAVAMDLSHYARGPDRVRAAELRHRNTLFVVNGEPVAFGTTGLARDRFPTRS